MQFTFKQNKIIKHKYHSIIRFIKQIKYICSSVMLSPQIDILTVFDKQTTQIKM